MKKRRKFDNKYYTLWRRLFFNKRGAKEEKKALKKEGLNARVVKNKTIGTWHLYVRPRK